MDPEFVDLIPLFVGEARERLERLAGLAGLVEGDRAALADARRELHTLKGAGRMLRLAALADLCHATEGALLNPRDGTAALLTRVVDRLAGMIEELGQGHEPMADPALLAALGDQQEQAAGATAPAIPAPSPALPAPASTDEVRIDTTAMDLLTDRATRLRILALGAAGFSERLLELARLAEAATRDSQPGQALAVLATSLRHLGIELEAGQQRLVRTAEAHLDRILALQIQPLRGFFLTLARHARDLARSLGREVEVIIKGEDTKLDRRIVRVLEEALIHLVRNAVDHGIEPPEQRLTAGKPRSGTLRLIAAAAGARVKITIADDGAGIDPIQVARAARAAGLIDDEVAAGLSADEAARLLFSPGFSTRAEVSDVSGRGVGLDAVAASVSRVGGAVRISSRPGEGTDILVDVPAALRGEGVLVVRVGSLRLAVPSGLVRRVQRLAADAVIERGGRTLASLDDRLVPFVNLAESFGETPVGVQLLLEGNVGDQSIAVAVDAIDGEEEVLIRPLAHAAESSPLVDAVALLASGEPLGVLSPVALAQHDLARTTPTPRIAARARRIRVLLVDDSLVTREMERRLLEDAGFGVMVAGDAAEALTHLAEGSFDCVVTDIEMPGMDGLELTRRLRAIPHLAQLPVVVVSTRDRPEDRLRGLESGADAYLTKQGLDATELVTVVRRLGGR